MAESPSDVFTKISNKEASAGQWMIVSFDAKKKLAVDATGEGFESLNKALDDAKCAWVCFNVHGVDVRENVQSVRTKLVQYNWVGDKVPSMKKMQALSGKPKVAKLFKGIACTFDINSKEDISAKEIGNARNILWRGKKDRRLTS
mmetsp:Transcript_16612/g.23266  ORF Transcript_16612/g.23266 Transcript_16612/m.23266 type:complete len:145 (-) Transcript_16612:401-835(-)